jgi:hypothetical protein
MDIVDQHPDVRFARVNPRPATVPGETTDRSHLVSAGARRTVAAPTAHVVPQPAARTC